MNKGASKLTNFGKLISNNDYKTIYSSLAVSLSFLFNYPAEVKRDFNALIPKS